MPLSSRSRRPHETRGQETLAPKSIDGVCPRLAGPRGPANRLPFPRSTRHRRALPKFAAITLTSAQDSASETPAQHPRWARSRPRRVRAVRCKGARAGCLLGIPRPRFTEGLVEDFARSHPAIAPREIGYGAARPLWTWLTHHPCRAQRGASLRVFRPLARGHGSPGVRRTTPAPRLPPPARSPLDRPLLRRARTIAAAPIAVPVAWPRPTIEARTRPRAPLTSTATPYLLRPSYLRLSHALRRWTLSSAPARRPSIAVTLSRTSTDNSAPSHGGSSAKRESAVRAPRVLGK